MQLQFVGCGDAFGSGGRYNTCFHVTGAQANFLIDCGATSLVALKALGIDRNAIDTILITHFHADHFGGLPFLMLDAQFGKRERPLTIAGPPGLESWFARAMETAFEHSSKSKQRFDLNLVTLADGATHDFSTFTATPFPVVHGNSGGPFFAYRLDVEGRIVAYSGDTEWTDTLIDAGRDADLFVCECYVYERPVRNHLSWAVLEQNLPRIAPKRLALTHLSEDMLAHRHMVPHLAAADGMVVEL